jgi:hypothetical protein
VTYGASSQFIGLAIVCLVVAGFAVAHHGHDVGEGCARAVVLVCVEENSQTLKVIRRAKNGALCRALLGEPHGEAIAVQVSLSVDLEFKFDLLPCLVSATVA